MLWFRNGSSRVLSDKVDLFLHFSTVADYLETDQTNLVNHLLKLALIL